MSKIEDCPISIISSSIIVIIIIIIITIILFWITFMLVNRLF